jgi:ATP-dependent RNA helicase DeaD
MSQEPTQTFADLGLPESLLAALSSVGYETPSPIQSATIPPLLQGRDVLGQAQTGTGKTAAFALPILAHIDLNLRANQNPQALVLAPTRELAIQVAEAFQRYASHIPGFHVLPIYGGQSYTPQLRGLQRGAHVVVGTPGRVIDHMEKGSLDLSHIKTLVLDEADEMLRMGFVDDVEAVLKRIPEQRRIALFSATMPRPIARIAETYLRDPVRVAIASKTTTASTVRQRYWQVSGMHKLDALTRILEVEAFEAMIVFSRTKQGTEELAEKLEARGFSAAAINGDVQQSIRERTIGKLKDGSLDILVATDVAARGLDVERISHVINFDIPVDTESYVHRIGRTGRAGRSGEAILFVTPRERHLLRAIERATRQPIEAMTLPSIGDVNDVRVARFKDKIAEVIAEGELEQFRAVVESFEQERNVPAIEIAAALAKLAQGKKPLLLKERDSAAWANEAPASTRPVRENKFERPNRESTFVPRDARPVREARAERAPRVEREFDDSVPSMRPRSNMGERFAQYESGVAPSAPRERSSAPRRDDDKQTYKIAVGHAQQVKPGNIVGAIANEIGLDSSHIGRIEIFDDYTLVDLPAGMPEETFSALKRVRVAQTPLMIEVWDGKSEASQGRAERPRFEKSPFAARPEREGLQKPRFSDEGARPKRFASFEDKPGFKKPDRFGNNEGMKKSFAKGDGFKSDSYKSEGYKKPEGFGAAPGFKKEFKKDGFKSEGFKKADGFKKPFAGTGDSAPAKSFKKPGESAGFAPPTKRKGGANPFRKF